MYDYGGCKGKYEYMRKVLVTGAAGFIGFHLCKRILKFTNEAIETIMV